MPPNTVKVDRSTRWGNPFKVLRPGNRISVAYSIARFFLWLTEDAKRTIREHLRGKNLGCWCDLDAPCHADVLLEIANEEGAR
jgi:hypothetical protein